MFYINPNSHTITVTRGDTACFEVKLNGYEPSEGDELVMTIKRRKEDTASQAIMTKKAEDMIFCFAPEETIDLLGRYHYDIQLTTAAGAVYTPIVSAITFERGVTE